MNSAVRLVALFAFDDVGVVLDLSRPVMTSVGLPRVMTIEFDGVGQLSPRVMFEMQTLYKSSQADVRGFGGSVLTRGNSVHDPRPQFMTQEPCL